VSHSLGYGTSSGDLNTGGNISQMMQMMQIFWQQITKSLCEEYKERSLKEKAQPGDVTSAGWANKKEKY